MPAQLHRLLERSTIIMMLAGIFGMFQPWIFGLFGWGFLLLLASTVGFTIISNISYRNEEPDAVSTT